MQVNATNNPDLATPSPGSRRRQPWTQVLRLERLCRVWRDTEGGWFWRCALCTPEPLPYTGRGASQAAAFADARDHSDRHEVRSSGRRTFAPHLREVA